MNYEYGIAYAHLSDPHRTGMTREEAEKWLRDDETGLDYSHIFRIIRRPVGPWEEFLGGSEGLTDDQKDRCQKLRDRLTTMKKTLPHGM